ncbi:hypothetical protein BDY17DRAFT_296659 [Neohortaea acidophila]|uniref:Vegetative cell wall protein gp1 n=1 Tax=Neohortaea acidophila TaxID=245834 RepID=A0A6A6PSF1_9PEZI|nr:uncharacterized protein BDY17DRAFT_296659 [Neohortaea acidophila]KAF2483030.1 hypothetical protein BDY17DRAFT_296659 [Neohortaea acidophila]
MFQTAGYPAHPPRFYFDYPRTPQKDGGLGQNFTRHFSYIATPPRGHARRATGEAATFAFSSSPNSTPRRGAAWSVPEYTAPRDDYYYTSAQSTPARKANYVPIFTSSAEPKKKHKSSRSRRFSFTTTQKTTRPTAQRRPSTAPKPPPQATAEDARRHRIPAGYSIKNWDPTEEPILLLGSVFDANSLGKWIYDWSVYFYGPATPMSEVAGELWLLLIQLAGKIKRAEECLDRIRQQGWRDVVDEFLEAGERLWQRFTKLLKVCEGYMWKAAKKECGGAQRVTMGKNSGCEFVDSMFGRDRELVQTEKFMASVRLWSWRFDKNCDEILRHPTA